MNSTLQNRRITISIDPTLDGFVKGELAQRQGVSEQDYIVSVLNDERQRRVMERLRDKQLANSISDGRSRDLI